MAHAATGGRGPPTAAVLLVATGMLVLSCAESNLRQAVSDGDLRTARRQIEGEGMSPELPDKCGWTLLHYASYYQHTPLVEYLAGRSVDVNARTRLSSGYCIMASHVPPGSTPLIIAAYYGQTDIIRVLLQFGADRQTRNADGYSALMYARRYEFAEAARLLAGTGTDP